VVPSFEGQRCSASSRGWFTGFPLRMQSSRGINHLAGPADPGFLPVGALGGVAVRKQKQHMVAFARSAPILVLLGVCTGRAPRVRRQAAAHCLGRPNWNQRQLTKRSETNFSAGNREGRKSNFSLTRTQKTALLQGIYMGKSWLLHNVGQQSCGT